MLVIFIKSIKKSIDSRFNTVLQALNGRMNGVKELLEKQIQTLTALLEATVIRVQALESGVNTGGHVICTMMKVDQGERLRTND